MVSFKNMMLNGFQTKVQIFRVFIFWSVTMDAPS